MISEILKMILEISAFLFAGFIIGACIVFIIMMVKKLLELIFDD